MKRKTTRKKIFITIISLFSTIVICYGIYALLIFNPKLSYSNKTQFGQVTVYHNQELEGKTREVITNAIEIVKNSEIYDENRKINLCLNDDKIYPNLYPIEAYAYTSIVGVILKEGEFEFNENLVVMYRHEKNIYQEIDLTWVLAHEFTHSMQYNTNKDYYKSTTKKQINWKLEGHADFIARNFKNDGRLKEKIDEYLIKYQKGDDWAEVFINEDGEKQIEQYYNYYNKYSLLVQYLMEIKGVDYYEICDLETSSEQVYSEMMEWRNK
jgi:hypothetical protein